MSGAYRTAIVAALLVVVSADPRAQATAAGPPYAGRLLVDVLQDLNRHGLRIVFSTSLVKPSWRVAAEPPGPSPRQILDQVLRPYALQARPGPQGVLMVARAPRQRDGAAPVPGTLRGRVVDADTDQPLSDALVVIQRPERRTTTDADGRFEFAGVLPGTQPLFVSLVGYSLARPDVHVPGDGIADIVIPLAAGAGAYTEQLTVQGTEEAARSATPARFSVGNFELTELRGVLADDPFRALQSLPNAATGDDFRAEFSVRGSEFRQMGLSLDGVPAPWLVHAVHADEDTATIGMINGDLLDEATLSSGALPQVYGNRTGAQLDLTMRDGSRDAFRVGGLISGTSASLVAEGPIGHTRRGAWIATVRQSYIDWLIRRIDGDGGTSFGFTDAQGKAAFDLSPRHQLSLTVVAGRSKLDEPQDNPTISDVRFGRAATGMAIGAWRATVGSSLTVTQRVGWAGLTFHNTNDFNQDVDRGRQSSWTWRADAAYGLRPWLALEGGASLNQEWATAVSTQYLSGGATPAIDRSDTFERDRWRQGGYLRARLDPLPALSVDGGARLDRESVYDETTMSPWLLARWSLGDRLTFRGGGGVAHQLPDLAQLSPEGAVEPAMAERARYLDASAEYRLSQGLDVQVSLYDRQESGTLRQNLSRPRLANGALVFPFFDGLWSNATDVSSHGLEVMLRRAAPSGLVGWVSYVYGKTRATDLATGEQYWGEFDQRHMLNLHASYRFGSRTNASAKLRVGSNMPVPGYFGLRGSVVEEQFLMLDSTRNNLRLPVYSRLDLRVNRTYNFTKRRLTLYVEVLNVLDRENLGPTNGAVLRNGTVFGFVETLFPVLPSAGIRLEF